MQTFKSLKLSTADFRLNAGFTLMELIITTAILAIVLSLAVPSVRITMANNQIATANNAIVSALNLARSEAITRANQVSVCPSNAGNNCNNNRWNRGWIVFDNLDGNGIPAGTEIIRRDRRDSSVTPSGFNGAVTFQANGTTTLAGPQTITICFNDTTVTNKCRSITISRFGSIKSVTTTS